MTAVLPRLVVVRTTITLDADTEVVVRRLMERRQISFEQAVNDAIRQGTDPGGAVTSARRMGVPAADLEQALQLHGQLEDEEIARRIKTGH